jgi:hypothetical protein
MNSNYENEVETQIDRELKALPSLRAPASLAPRVFRAIEQQAARPWYQRAWQTWPAGLQVVSLAVLLAMFGGLCISAWTLTHSEAGEAAMQKAGGWFSVLGTISRTLTVLADAASLAVHQLGTGVIVGGIVAVIIAWIACVGLGTICVRLAMRPMANRIEI